MYVYPIGLCKPYIPNSIELIIIIMIVIILLLFWMFAAIFQCMSDYVWFVHRSNVCSFHRSFACLLNALVLMKTSSPFYFVWFEWFFFLRLLRIFCKRNIKVTRTVTMLLASIPFICGTTYFTLTKNKIKRKKKKRAVRTYKYMLNVYRRRERQ